MPRPATPRAAAPGPVDVDLSGHPDRCDYAHPGEPIASLGWAATMLDERGLGAVPGVLQQRTWNLSAIWRLDTGYGPVWLKQVPRFFAHEPAVLGYLAGTEHGRTWLAIAAEIAARTG